MKHSSDDGNLTLFAAEGEILIACDRGHYWRFAAQEGKVERPRLRDSDVAESRGAAMDPGELDLDKFGPAAVEALRPD